MHPIWRLTLGSIRPSSVVQRPRNALMENLTCIRVVNFKIKLYHPRDQRCMNAISRYYMCVRDMDSSKLPILEDRTNHFLKWVANQHDIWYLCEFSTWRFFVAWKSAWKFLFMFTTAFHTSAVFWGDLTIENSEKESCNTVIIITPFISIQA